MRTIPATRKECRHIKKIIVLKDCIVLYSYNYLLNIYVYSIWSRESDERIYDRCFTTYKELFLYIKVMRGERRYNHDSR